MAPKMISYTIFMLLFCIYNLVEFSSAQVTSTTDANLLLSVKSSLMGSDQDNIVLSTWNSSIPICRWRGLEWYHQDEDIAIDCNSSSRVRDNLALLKDPSIYVSAIELSAIGLKGTIPKDLGKLSNLKKLYLNVNQLTGSVPLELGNSLSLSFLSLSQNNLSGTLPPSLWNLCPNLVELHLDHNGFLGAIPMPPLPNATCPNVRKLDFSNNQLSGGIPLFLNSFTGLRELELNNNSLSGNITLANLTNLSVLNLAYNNFSGAIPVALGKFSSDDFIGNGGSLCGAPLVPCGMVANSDKRGGLSPGAVAGIVIALMAAMVTVVSVIIVLGTSHERRDYRNDFEEEETMEGRLVLFEGGEHLSVEDLLSATGQVLGKTSYGTVYKAKLSHGGGTIVLRLLREGTVTDRETFLHGVTDLGRLRHENLVPLRALYEGERGEKLLAYDFMAKGSLADMLHGPTRQHLTWARRHKIALGAARGLAHLHTGLERPIIHANLKSKNVLVDEHYVAHLTDYGLDKLLSPGAASEMMAGSSLEGYKAPELKKVKKANTKTDVYNFGILMLEILLGRKTDQKSGDEIEEFVDLPSIVKTAVLEEKVMEVFDVEILKGGRNPSDDGLLVALQLAMGCCAPSPSARPDIKEVVKQLEDMRPRMHSPLYTPRSANLD